MAKKAASNKKKKNNAKNKLLDEEKEKVCKRFLRTYNEKCAQTGTAPFPTVRRVFLDEIQQTTGKYPDTITIIQPTVMDKTAPLPYAFQPLWATIREMDYVSFKKLNIWGMPFLGHALSSMCDTLDAMPQWGLEEVDLYDCLLSDVEVMQLSTCFTKRPLLATIRLDQNAFGDRGAQYLYKHLVGDLHITTLSLNYCNITDEGAAYISKLATSTVIQNLYLDGNEFTCHGLSAIILPLTDAALTAEIAAERPPLPDETTTTATTRPPSSGSSKGKKKGGKKKGGKKKGGKKKKKKVEEPLVPGAYLKCLHLADNEMDMEADNYITASSDLATSIAELVRSTTYMTELDLSANQMGRMAGLELLRGLKARSEVTKEKKLAGVTVLVDHGPDPATMKEIMSLAGGSVKKKRKGGKKGKKKK